MALIDGADLDPWHSQPLWREKNENASSKFSPVRSYDRKRVAIYREAQERMAETVMKTVAQANGQTVLRNLKNKESRFATAAALQEHIAALITMQETLGALTGLPLELDERGGDKEFFCSLDRRDSDGHYEAGNLQVICRFANRWKGADEDAEFQSLRAEERRVGKECVSTCRSRGSP